MPLPKALAKQRLRPSKSEGLAVFSESFKERLDGQDRDVVLQFAAGEDEHFPQERLGQLPKWKIKLAPESLQEPVLAEKLPVPTRFGQTVGVEKKGVTRFEPDAL